MNKLSVLGIVVAMWAQVAHPCGSEVSNLKPGDKILGIEITNNSDPIFSDPKDVEKEIAVDNDGMLAVGITAFYCNQTQRSMS